MATFRDMLAAIAMCDVPASPEMPKELVDPEAQRSVLLDSLLGRRVSNRVRRAAPAAEIPAPVDDFTGVSGGAASDAPDESDCAAAVRSGPLADANTARLAPRYDSMFDIHLVEKDRQQRQKLSALKKRYAAEVEAYEERLEICESDWPCRLQMLDHLAALGRPGLNRAALAYLAASRGSERVALHAWEGLADGDRASLQPIFHDPAGYMIFPRDLDRDLRAVDREDTPTRSAVPTAIATPDSAPEASAVPPSTDAAKPQTVVLPSTDAAVPPSTDAAVLPSTDAAGRPAAAARVCERGDGIVETFASRATMRAACRHGLVILMSKLVGGKMVRVGQSHLWLASEGSKIDACEYLLSQPALSDPDMVRLLHGALNEANSAWNPSAVRLALKQREVRETAAQAVVDVICGFVNTMHRDAARIIATYAVDADGLRTDQYRRHRVALIGYWNDADQKRCEILDQRATQAVLRRTQARAITARPPTRPPRDLIRHPVLPHPILPRKTRRTERLGTMTCRTRCSGELPSWPLTRLANGPVPSGARPARNSSDP